jgi:F-type H+-transporting ATPase subunit epsilon
MQIDIITPDASLFSGQGTSVTVPGIDGSLGILENHAPLITALKKGQVKLVEVDGSEKHFDINGGVAEVIKNKVIILAE